MNGMYNIDIRRIKGALGLYHYIRDYKIVKIGAEIKTVETADLYYKKVQVIRISRKSENIYHTCAHACLSISLRFIWQVNNVSKIPFHSETLIIKV